MSHASGSDPSESAVSSPVRVGVLSFHNSKETKSILNAVAALGHEPVWLREENARTWIESGSLRFEPDVDVVANRLLLTKATRPLDDLGVTTAYTASRPVLNPPDAVARASHKYGAAATLAAAGIPVPDAYMAFTSRTLDERDRLTAGAVVHKSAIGTNGVRMAMVEGSDAVSPRIDRHRAFLQEFIDVGAERAFDVRVYVVDGRVVGAMKRYAPSDEWRTNVAVGGDVEDFTDALSDEAARISRDATDALGLDYAGVDLLCRGDEWYVLEVNVTAGFKGLFAATGISPAPYIARLAIERGGGRVDSGRVTALSTELDDSVPDCKPSLGSGDRDPETIGYTERVVVSADHGTADVVAKSDTGARRSSIDLDTAASVGAGPVVDTTQVRSGSRSERRKRALVDVDIRVGGRWHTVTASIENRSHMKYPVLLGRDVLESYRVNVTKRSPEE